MVEKKTHKYTIKIVKDSSFACY